MVNYEKENYMGKSQLYAGASRPGDFKHAEEEKVKREALLENKLPVANPISERQLAKIPPHKTSILEKHY